MVTTHSLAGCCTSGPSNPPQPAIFVCLSHRHSHRHVVLLTFPVISLVFLLPFANFFVLSFSLPEEEGGTMCWDNWQDIIVETNSLQCHQRDSCLHRSVCVVRSMNTTRNNNNLKKIKRPAGDCRRSNLILSAIDGRCALHWQVLFPPFTPPPTIYPTPPRPRHTSPISLLYGMSNPLETKNCALASGSFIDYLSSS